MSLTFCRRLPLRIINRSFSTTSCRSISLQIDRNDPEDVADVVPPYPHGPATFYKQSDKGLYGGQKLRFGNNVGPKFETKSRRKFRPNVTNKRLWSRALNRWVQVRVTTRVLRTIDKVGGLDEYLLGEKEARIRELGMSGWWLRWAIMQTPMIQKRFEKQRKALGIDELQAELGEHSENLTGEPAAPAKAAKAGQELLDEVYEGTGAELANAESLQGEGEVEMDILDTDGAFQVETTPNLPPLKFRVGPAQHIVLTPDGWRRTRPGATFLHDARMKWGKEQLRKKYKMYIQDHLARFEQRFNKKYPEVDSKEREQALATARMRYEFDWDAALSKAQAKTMSNWKHRNNQQKKPKS